MRSRREQREAEALEAWWASPAADEPSAASDDLDPALAAAVVRLEGTLRPPEPDTAFITALRQRLEREASSQEVTAAVARGVARSPRRATRRRIVGRGPLVLLAALLALLLAASAVSGASLLRAHAPGQRPSGNAAFAIAAALPWLLCQPAAFQPMDPAQAARQTGRPIAYLPQPPAGMAATPRLSLPGMPGVWPDPKAVAYGPRAVVVYQGDGHMVVVELDEPSPGMALRELLVGESTIHLANGKEAYASTFPGWPVPNAVAFLSGPYVVTVASDLAPEAVAPLAGQVVVAPAAAARSMPAAAIAPTAIIAPRPGTGPSDVVVTGRVRDRRDWWPGGALHIAYDLAIASRGCGSPATQVEATVVFPPALAGRVRDPNPPVRYATLGGAGFGGDVNVDIAGVDPATLQAALAQGISVRVRWQDGNRPRERVYAIAPSG